MEAVQPDILEQEIIDVEKRNQMPPMYRVMLFNDDFTTKDFVVELLVTVFHKGVAEAVALMYRIHNQGRGVAGVYPREVAETKISIARELARENGFPLQLSMEPET
jgi:ATP-dependent Clp protease adaptor protein ClpS